MIKSFLLLSIFFRSINGNILDTDNLYALKKHLLNNYRADTIPTMSEPLNLSMGVKALERSIILTKKRGLYH